VPGKQGRVPPGQPPPHLDGLPGRRRLAERHPVQVQQRVAAEHQRIRAQRGHRGRLAFREGGHDARRVQAVLHDLIDPADHDLGIDPGVPQHAQPRG
jgi:hypothetical protein